MANEQVLTAEQVIDKARTYLPEEQIAFVEKAYLYAQNAHREQYRKSGEPYIIHPIQVAGILVDLEMDPSTIAGGFLHDVVEDTDVTLDDLKEAFSEEVAMLVDGVTKLGKIKYKSQEERAGGKPSKNVCRYGSGYQSHIDQAGGSPSQYADVKASSAGKATENFK